MPYPALLRRVVLGISLLSLTGCATLAPDRGLGDVHALLGARDSSLATRPDSLNSSSSEIASRVHALLAEPLTPDQAISVALLRNPLLRAEYARLGLAQADVIQASRLSNPVLSFSALSSSAPAQYTRFDYGLVQNFTDALFLHSRSSIAKGELDRAKALAAASIQTLAADVAKAYFQLEGAQQMAQMRQVVAKAAEVSGDLAQRFYAAGNINELEFRMEQAAGTQAQLDVDAAAADVATAYTALNALMGLRAAEADWKIVGELPLPVEDEADIQTLRDLALVNRLDLTAKRAEANSLARILELSKTLRWLPFVSIGVQGERDNDGSHLLGPSVSLELPIFGQSRSGVLRAQALLDQSQAGIQILESEIGNAVTAAYKRMIAARTRVTRHLTQLIPEREAVVARTSELQAYMIVGQFQLLVAKQQEYAAYGGYLEALRDYWIARAELARQVGARLPSDAYIGEASVGAVILPDKAPGGHVMRGGPAGMQGMDINSMKGMDHSDHASDSMEGMHMKDMPGMAHSLHKNASVSKKQKPSASKESHQHHHGDQP